MVDMVSVVMLHEKRRTRVGGAEALAALRIASGVAGILTADGLMGFRVPPEGLRFPPPGTAWLGFLPVSQELFDAAAIGLLAASVAVTVGWRSRWAAGLAATFLFYAGWVTTLTGKVDHAHHVLWAFVLVSVSPAANAWAVRREASAGSFRWPIETMVLFLGLAYFSSGLAKILSAGFAWGWSDNLVNTMLAQALENGREPALWLLDYPLVGRVLGTAGLLFELVFLPLAAWPVTRRWVWPIGLVFHLGTWLILGISFLTIQLLYVVFLPWQFDGDPDPAWAQRAVCLVLVGTMVAFSLLGERRAWPVAAYPGFEGIHPPELAVLKVHADGGVVLLPEHELSQWVAPQRARALTWSALASGKEEELAAWIGADSLVPVTVDLRAAFGR